jgi:hypothetical protein
MMLLNGVWVQLFERGLLQELEDGQVVSVNLLEADYLPYESFGDLNLPPVESALIDNAPDPSEPGFGVRSQEFIQANAPEAFEALAPRFYTTFLGTVGFYDAFFDGQGDPALLPGFSLEMWGLPTSYPAYAVQGDRTDTNTVLLRFQRGVMRHDVDHGTTRRVELGYYLRSILIGDDSQAAFADAAAASPLWAQYNPDALNWVDRSDDLLESNLVLAFTRDDTGEEAVALPARTAPGSLLITAATVVYSNSGEPLWIAQPGESYQVRRQQDGWALVDGDQSGPPGWIRLDDVQVLVN